MPITKTLAHWLTTPVRFDLGPRARLRMGLISGLAVFGVLALYQPFGTYEDPLEHKYWLLSGYGLATALVVAGVHSLAALWVRSRASPHWSRARHAVFLLAVWVLGSTANYGYYCWVFAEGWLLSGWLRFLWLTFLVGIYPVALITLTLKTRPVEEVQESESTADEDSAREASIVLEGENRDERLHLLPSQILFAKAADNYCEVVYREADGVRRRLLRCTLTRLAEQLEALAIRRCHRSYLVNLDRVVETTGNSQTFRLHLADYEEPIPVARAYVGAVRQELSER